MYNNKNLSAQYTTMIVHIIIATMIKMVFKIFNTSLWNNNKNKKNYKTANDCFVFNADNLMNYKKF